jgi:hypothetical protein
LHKNKKLLCRNILENLTELIPSKGHKRLGVKRLEPFFALSKIRSRPVGIQIKIHLIPKARTLMFIIGSTTHMPRDS